MANEQFELKRINWAETFSFTHLFKGFKMAVQPSKLLLAFVAVVIFFVSAWVLDKIWGACNQYTLDKEPMGYVSQSPDEFQSVVGKWKKNRPTAAAELHFKELEQEASLSDYSAAVNAKVSSGFFVSALSFKDVTNTSEMNADKRKQVEERAKDDWAKVVGDAQKSFDREVEKIENVLDNARQAARKSVEDSRLGKEEAREALKAVDNDYSIASRELVQRKVRFHNEVQAVRGVPILETFLNYEMNCIDGAIAAVRYGNFTGGLAGYSAIMKRHRSYDMAEASMANPLGSPAPADNPPGFLVFLLLAVHGFQWLLACHWLIATVYLLIVLCTVAVLGGAINRIAALHFAREEKMSAMQALRFSLGKFFSFLTAPLIPLTLIVGLGALLALGALTFGNFAGGILLGVFFFLTIVMGLVIAFGTIGLVAGSPLMYPTIAVEGSDSFDAMSRSFSYVFNRPWRGLFYGMIAVVYGVITYLFVRLFAFVALAGAHMFLKWGIFTGGETLSPLADRIDVIWTKPTFDSLLGPFNWFAMSGAEKVAAVFIGIWVFVVAGMVAAYVLSYLACSTTIIYYLLRKRVDATDLDDVYVEESSDELAAPAVAAPAAPVVPLVPPAPPVEPPPAAPSA